MLKWGTVGHPGPSGPPLSTRVCTILYFILRGTTTNVTEPIFQAHIKIGRRRQYLDAIFKMNHREQKTCF